MKNNQLIVVAVVVLLAVVMGIGFFLGNSGENSNQDTNSVQVVENGNRSNDEGRIDNSKIYEKVNEIQKEEGLNDIIVEQSKYPEFESSFLSTVQGICSGKKDLVGATCGSGYKMNLGILYSLIDDYGFDKLDDTDIDYLFDKGILKHCMNLNDEDRELLFHKMSKFDKTCYKDNQKEILDVLGEIKDHYKQLDVNFSEIEWNYDNLFTNQTFSKPYLLFLSLEGTQHIAEDREVEIKLSIIREFNKKLESDGVDKGEFQRGLLKVFGTKDINELKEEILSEYEYIHKTHLKSTGFKLEGLENTAGIFRFYRENKDQLNNVIGGDKFKSDFEKVKSMISAYNYITKVFIGSRFRVKEEVGEKGVGLLDLVYLDNLINK